MSGYSRFLNKTARASWKAEVVSSASARLVKDKINELASLHVEDFERIRSLIDTALQQPWLEKIRLMTHRNPINEKTVLVPPARSSVFAKQLETVLTRDLATNLQSEFISLYEQNYLQSNAPVPSNLYDFFKSVSPIALARNAPTSLLPESLEDEDTPGQTADQNIRCEWITLKEDSDTLMSVPTFIERGDMDTKPYLATADPSSPSTSPSSTSTSTSTSASASTTASPDSTATTATEATWSDRPLPGGRVFLYLHGGAFVMGRPRWAVYQELALAVLKGAKEGSQSSGATQPAAGTPAAAATAGTGTVATGAGAEGSVGAVGGVGTVGNNSSGSGSGSGADTMESKTIADDFLASHATETLTEPSAPVMGVFSVDYRLAPAHPYPRALLDCIAAYEYLLKQGIRPQDIVIAGDSAGGNLALALALSLARLNLPEPAGLVLLSPFADLTMGQEAMEALAEADPLLPADGVQVAIKTYLSFAKSYDRAEPVLKSGEVQGEVLSGDTYPPPSAHWLQDNVRAVAIAIGKEYEKQKESSELDTVASVLRGVPGAATERMLSGKVDFTHADKRLLLPAAINAMAKHWSVSPVRADRKLAQGLPPTLLVAGGSEILMGDSVAVMEMALSTQRVIDLETKTTQPSAEDISKGDLLLDEEGISWDDVSITVPEYSEDTYNKSVSVEPICAKTFIKKRDGGQVPMYAHVYPCMFHVFLLSPFLPETKHALNTLYGFIRDDCKWSE